MLEQQQELIQLRIRVLKEYHQNVTLEARNDDLCTLVSEARPFVQLFLRWMPTACWAHEWLQRANEQLEEEQPR